MDKKSQNNNKKGIVFAGLGFELAGLVIASVTFGGQLDAHYGWAGYGVAGLTILSLIGWLFHLIFMLQRWQKNG